MVVEQQQDVSPQPLFAIGPAAHHVQQGLAVGAGKSDTAVHRLGSTGGLVW